MVHFHTNMIEDKYILSKIKYIKSMDEKQPLKIMIELNNLNKLVRAEYIKIAAMRPPIAPKPPKKEAKISQKEDTDSDDGFEVVKLVRFNKKKKTGKTNKKKKRR